MREHVPDVDLKILSYHVLIRGTGAKIGRVTRIRNGFWVAEVWRKGKYEPLVHFEDGIEESPRFWQREKAAEAVAELWAGGRFHIGDKPIPLDTI